MNLPDQKSAIFQNDVVPKDCSLAGLSALVQFFDVKAPVRKPACISEKTVKGHIKETESWRIFSKRYSVKKSKTIQSIFIGISTVLKSQSSCTRALKEL